MPERIHSLLADELNISAPKAEKLLSAMLREVRKRAEKGGVRLPELGKFKEVNGTLTFEPSESLARAVNHRFEGLESEDLASAPAREEEDDQDDEGPSTITLGYQDSSWSPLDSEEETEPSDSDEDEGADTEEFEVPGPEEAADTDELQVPPSESAPQPETSSASREASASPDSGTESPQTEELYPLVEDVADEEDSASSASSGTGQGTEDAEREELSGIWDSDSDDSGAFSDRHEKKETSEPFAESSGGPSLDDIKTDAGENEEERAPSPSPSGADASSSAPSPADTTEESSSGSTAPRIFVGLLVVLLLGGGAWYVLGRRGMVPPPRTSLAQLQSKTQATIQNLQASFSSGSATASSQSSDAAGESSADDAPPSAATTTPAGNQSAASTSSDATSSSGTEPSSAQSQGIDPSAGGYSIVVASRADRAGAEDVLATFRQRFSGQNVPVDILEGTVNNTTRYRVGVGQFSSRQEAQNFLQKYGNQLPEGAWPLQL